MNPTDLQPKLIYATRRNPQLSRAQFVPRWREHGALGMSMPRWRNIARYVHCDVLYPPRATAALSTEHDGVGLVWHRSYAARAAHVADTSSRERMERDERETFAEPVVNVCVVTREVVLLSPDRANVPCVKLTRFQTARNRARAIELAEHRLAEGARLRERLHQAGAPVHGHVVNVPLPREGGGQWGLAVDCVEELWLAGVEDAVVAAEHLALESARESAHEGAREDGREIARETAVSGGPAPPSDGFALLTNEVLLYRL